MALQATHVRFAKTLFERANVRDDGSYYSGAVYPDSRYVTGVKRDETHYHGVPKLPFSEEMSDFEKGWATHLFYDEHAGKRLRELFGIKGRIYFGDDAWLKATAAKIIEDMESCRNLHDTWSCISACSPVVTPRGEDVKKLRIWYDAQKQLYANEPMRFSCYEASFANTRDFPTAKLEPLVDSFLKDDKLVKEICSIFPHVTSLYE